MIVLKKPLLFWSVTGFVFTVALGTFLHFLYELTGQSILAAPFSAVNESTWEHMKILFFPMFVFSFIEYRYIGKNHRDFWCVKLAGTLTGLILIPTLFYTYTGAFGVSADWFNIAIFFIAAGAAYLLEAKLLKSESYRCKAPLIAFIVLCIIAAAFIVLTFVQPEIPLFKDPITNTYGI